MNFYMNFRFLFLSFLFLTINTCFAYEPLVGSDWAQVHPDLLPYESCRMVSGLDKKSWISSRFLGLGIFGINFDSGNRDELFFYCKSDQLNIEFFIPLVKHAHLNTGFVPIQISPSNERHAFFHFENKKVSDLLGGYHGGKIALMNLGCGSYRNKSGVINTYFSAGIEIIEVCTAYSFFYLSLDSSTFNEAKLGNGRYNDNRVVLGDIRQKRSYRHQNHMHISEDAVKELKFYKLTQNRYEYYLRDLAQYYFTRDSSSSSSSNFESSGNWEDSEDSSQSDQDQDWQSSDTEQNRKLTAKSDFCTYLGISTTSRHEEILRAYKKKVLEIHPDKNPDQIEKATAEFQVLQGFKDSYDQFFQ